MTKVVAPGSLPSSSLQMAGGALKVGSTVKRKTPSELRGEQLKRTNVIELVDESSAPFLGSKGYNSEVGNDHKKTEVTRNPRYIDTRMDEVFPAKKSRFRMLSGKENTKDNSTSEQLSSQKDLFLLSDMIAKRRDQRSSLGNSVASAEATENDGVQARQTIEKCSQSTFRSVTELSFGGERSSGLATVNMDKALKGLVACEPNSGLRVDPSERFGNSSSNYSASFLSECCILGPKAPLDFTLKTYMRVLSTASVNWIHRSIMRGVYNGVPQFTFRSSYHEDSDKSGITLASQILDSKALHSWVYPQSSLPSSLISILTSSAAGAEMDFLRKRQVEWEDSFRSLYYMLRKNACDIFYVCTSQFVVVFTVSDGSATKKRSCTAYVSQSTRALRSLLKEHDVGFSMPLCKSKVEQVTMEDLVELSEIEKHNLGQTRRVNSLSEIDNTPQSLLAFSDNKNVHGLYDFLLNYRSFLTLLNAVDVPVLCSPVPFQNAALSAPQVSCTEMKRADNVTAPKGFTAKDVEATKDQSSSSYCSIEIKDAYIPPWIVCNVCSIMGYEGRSFEASFVTDCTSLGLNIALPDFSDKPESRATTGEGLQQPTSHTFGISDATVTPLLRLGFLKGLKRCNDSYTASLSPL